MNAVLIEAKAAKPSKVQPRVTQANLIEKLDLRPYVEGKGGVVPEEVRGEAMQELKRYFVLSLSSKHYSMTHRLADMVWHNFVLHTQAYMAFSIAAFGRYFHHTPGKFMTEDSRCVTHEEFCEHYQAAFGELPPHLWHASSTIDCGNGDCQGCLGDGSGGGCGACG